MWVDDGLVVVPAWQQHAFGEDVVAIDIEPGGAFGLGDHPTTLLSLRAARRHLGTGRDVLDVGCGTGVIAVMAALIGASHVRAVDVASAAVEATRDNAARNGVADQHRRRHDAGGCPRGTVSPGGGQHSCSDADRPRRRSPTAHRPRWAAGDQRHPRRPPRPRPWLPSRPWSPNEPTCSTAGPPSPSATDTPPLPTDEPTTAYGGFAHRNSIEPTPMSQATAYGGFAHRNDAGEGVDLVGVGE